MAAVCGFVAYAIYGQAAQGHRIDTQVTTLERQNRDLKQQISDHQRQIVEAQTAAWLVEEARKLGYVFPGEKIFVIPAPGASPQGGGGVNAPLPSLAPLTSPSASASPSAAASPTATPAPTPWAFTLPTPSPH